MAKNSFEIDLIKEFPHLPNAPIVEAVIHWRARAAKSLNPESFFGALREKLPNYPNARPQQEIEMEMQAGPDGSRHTQQTHWHGFRFQAANERHIAQFTKNGFVFSRLKPYGNWEEFETEATRLWSIHKELANPSEVQRLGVRFINAIDAVQSRQLGKTLTLPPKSPPKMNLTVRGFTHQTRFEVPGHPYNLNVIQTIQPASAPDAKGETLIIDIDVFTTELLPCDDEILSKRLQEMRFLKDNAFFTLLKGPILKRFEGE